MEPIIFILLGIIFVVIVGRMIPSLVLEVVFFGAFFTLFEVYRFWIAETLSLPPLPGWLMISLTGALTFYAVMRIMYVVGIMFFPPLSRIPAVILGE